MTESDLPPNETDESVTNPPVGTLTDSESLQKRIQVLAQQLAGLEQELIELTNGQLDAVVTLNGEPPFLLAAARQALAESERRFRAIFDSALDAMLLCDDKGGYVDANPAACALFGVQKAHLLNKGLRDFAVASAHFDALWQAFLEQGKQTGEIQLQRADGLVVDAEYSAVAHIIPGRHLSVLRDVTAQKQAIRMRDELNVELERRNRGLMALHGIGVKLGESLRIHEVYETIFQEFTYYFLDSPHLAIALYDEAEAHFLCDYAVVDGEIYDPTAFPPMPLGEGPTSQAFLTRVPQIVDIDEMARKLPSQRIVHIGTEASPRSGLYVPLVVNNEAIGVLSVQHYEANAFQDVDLTLLSILANHAAAAISNARLYAQTQHEIADRKQRERELAAIAALARDLRPAQSQSLVVGTLLSQVSDLFEATGAAVVLHAEHGLVVAGAVGEFVAAHEPQTGATDDLEKELDDAGSGALNYREAVLVNDPAQLGRLSWGRAIEQTRGLGSVPLSVQNTTIGAVVVGMARLVKPADLDLLASLADIAASTIQRSRLYEQVQLQAQRLTRVMDTVMFGLLLLNRERRVVVANQPALEELEVLAGVRIGDELADIAGVPLDEILASPYGGVLGREIVTEDVPPRVYDVLANPVEIDGETDGWVLVIQDVTIDREVQAQLQRQDRLAAVGQLAAGIAHDFNNILAVIILYVQMLQRSSNLKESEQKRLTVIRDQAQHASTLIRQVLDFSRMSVMERHHLDLEPLLRATIGLWERILPENIRLVLSIDEEETYVVDGDASRLQQILMNLALNARDAMPKGGDLRVELSKIYPTGEEGAVPSNFPAGGWTRMVVADSGEGISAEHLPHIFDPFFTTKGVGKGTGLGLAQVYGIVQQHGGQVQVDSHPGVGTEFRILLPSIDPVAKPHTAESDSHALETGTGLILLVEDNEAARNATRAILELHGYEVVEATNGEEALAYFIHHIDDVDLVLSDLVMPEMGGLALYHAVAQLKPDICMLIMTGYPLDDEGRRLIEAGMVDWMQKPFSIQELADKVRRLMQ